MSLGEKLRELRKKQNLSQEDVAEKLGVSRQTISNWEAEQTEPEITKLKELCRLFTIPYDYLINEQSSIDLTNIEQINNQIDWTLAWSKKYPILITYSKMQGIERYQAQMAQLYDQFKEQFGTTNQDTVLILKDILYKNYQKKSK